MYLLTTINIAVLDLVVNLKCLFPFGQHLQFVHNFIIDIFWKEEYSSIVKCLESQNIRKAKHFDRTTIMVREKGELDMLEKMKTIIAEQLSVDADSIQADSNFKEDLGADSLDLFELVMALEEEFGVEIPSEDLESIATVNDVMEYLKNKGVEA